MKNIAVLAAIAMMSLSSGMEGSVGKQALASKCFSVVSGSYYADPSSEYAPQTIVLTGAPPLTAAVQFSGINVDHGVTLSLPGTSIVVPKKGLYKIEWNASLFFVQSPDVFYHFDLQKNGTTLLHPSPQVSGQVGDGAFATPSNSAAASVIVPLSCDDEISLLLTIDGSEGDNVGDGVQITSAQISATWISSPCDLE
ncbi:MAG: hypothetical protein JSR46_02420 [Verrucomicrobia bacterium]|nr:hypothetical protein [Verrucomicrobiota bacterium]